MQLGTGGLLEEVLEETHDVPAVFAAQAARGDAGGDQLVVERLELGVRLGLGDLGLGEEGLVVPDADARHEERHPALDAVKGHAGDRVLVDFAVPAVLGVVRREVGGLPGLGVGSADLAAPDAPDVRT
jgi:hypothetical protein